MDEEQIQGAEDVRYQTWLLVVFPSRQPRQSRREDLRIGGFSGNAREIEEIDTN
jgi:hypothetical protein